MTILVNVPGGYYHLLGAVLSSVEQSRESLTEIDILGDVPAEMRPVNV